jgi:3-oxoacyl-[acyl-carrier-protein] synthase III
MQTQSIGISSIGLHLPQEVRTNSWWPQTTVNEWMKRAVRTRRAMEEEYPRLESEGQRMALRRAMDELDDPFRGSVERRVLAADRSVASMEAAAARDAIERAGIDASEIDALLVHSYVPDYLATNNACSVHELVGLAPTCFSISLDAACNSFLMPLTMARAMIQAGNARKVLIVQSAACSRVLPYAESYSTWFGDGASAVVVGPVDDGLGLLSTAHRTDGSMQGTLVAGVRGGKWFDHGRTELFTENPPAAHKMFVVIPERSAEPAFDALRTAGIERGAVDFFACHQGNAWLRSVMQELFGLAHARTLDTFKHTASLIAANVPFVLGLAEREGLLRRGDTVLASSGGSGITYSAAVMKWASG